jgi:hypothetical protein
MGSVMLLSPAYSDTFEVMSGPPETPGHLTRAGNYMDPTDPRWSTLHSVRSTDFIVSISSRRRVLIFTKEFPAVPLPWSFSSIPKLTAWLSRADTHQLS